MEVQSAKVGNTSVFPRDVSASPKREKLKKKLAMLFGHRQ
jgi:hypothetical protein